MNRRREGSGESDSDRFPRLIDSRALFSVSETKRDT